MFLIDVSKNCKQSWKVFITTQSKLPYFQKLNDYIFNEYQKKIIYPNPNLIFNAFSFFEINQTNLVIIGQDPYQTKGMADGLAFSTKSNYAPKSINNILKEINKDLNTNRTNCDLADIAKQNVLLLNRILTVEANKSLSHANIGWETFTDNIIAYLSKLNPNVIYLLMGKNAQQVKTQIKKSVKIFLTSHPSPFSYRINFTNKKIFYQINEILIKLNKPPIKW